MGSDNFASIIKQLEKIAKETGDLEREEKFGGSFRLPAVQIKVTKRTSEADIARMMNKVNDLAIQYIREALESALNDAMQSNIWEGEDIVDTGELMRSLQISIQDNTLTMDYTAEYASFVHYGGYLMPYGNRSIEKVYIPGRPWVDAVVQGYAGMQPIDFAELYGRAFREVVG